MKIGFFYRTYSKMSSRNIKARLSITPLGYFTVSVCLISGLAGLNIFTADLYKLFSLSFSLLLVSYLTRDKTGSSMKDIYVSVFLGGRYNAGSSYKYSVSLHNGGSADVSGIEIIPVTGKNIPSFEEFQTLSEPDERKRNIWDRNIYYFRWVWHMFRLHKAEFTPVDMYGTLAAGAGTVFESEFRAVKRGMAELKGVYLIRKHILGLFSSFRFIELNERFYIYPAPAPIDPALSDRIRLDIARSASARSNIQKKFKAGDFVGIRDYVPGDPIKNIHWKTWAKRDRPAVIEKAVETVREISFLLINLNSGQAHNTSFEDCVSYIYSMIRKFEEDEYEISLYFFDAEGSVKLVHADPETGNFDILYSSISQLDSYVIDKEKTISKVKNHFDASSTLVFSHETDGITEEFCRTNNLRLFSGKDIPEVNTENYQINMP
ncbi:MAG: DUF58 domain-containing protein [Candidatus Delongbacteria bacterium]|nr:DUF58 domain-containing protein [Candidatus Delongbacteria bacterium]